MPLARIPGSAGRSSWSATPGANGTWKTASPVEPILRWRRGYLDKPALLSRSDPRHPILDPNYTELNPALLPDVENLVDTRQRVSNFWHELIQPRLRWGHNVLISSHGNTLRALLIELAGDEYGTGRRF